MIVTELKVENELGLHARVVSKLAREARKFQSDINVRKGGDIFSLKNVMSAIMVNAKKGDVLSIEVNGEDEQQASEAMAELFAQKFGER